MDRPLVEAAQRAILALNRTSVRYALRGGLAVAAHGIKRATKDIALLMAAEDIPAADRTLASDGWVQSGASITFPDGMTLHRRIRFEGNQHLLLDYLVPPPGRDWLDRRRSGELAGSACWLLPRDALIEMKRLAGRPQDLVDIGQLEALGNG